VLPVDIGTVAVYVLAFGAARLPMLRDRLFVVV
jgi:hypothetical protein